MTALRQYSHNHGEGFVFGYDKAETDRIVTGLVEALEEIIHPVRFMKERLEEGERLNGMVAVQLAKDAEYLRDIARKALTSLNC